MLRRLTFILLLAVVVAGCSGSIYRQRPVAGLEPVAITVDARQRVLLSQLDNRRGQNDPLFRRFCAEPSPDVFTVLGVSGSGGGSLGLGADSSVNAALQAAFSSSETGATIARTQTLNMLREMMFRTCERYLSGAISADEFPIIAARDQRIMVSILAIEQLTGSITPRGLAITSGGNAGTGANSAETLRLLTEARAAVVSAQATVAQKTTAQIAADTAAGGCAALKATVAAIVPPATPTVDQTNKLNACNSAEAARNSAVAARDAAQEHYETLVRASAGGLGTSTATTSGTAQEIGTAPERSQSVREVALAVEHIVAATFGQDETQLFCIRVLGGQNSALGDPRLQAQCLDYLVTQVNAERAQLARVYNLSDSEVRINLDRGIAWADTTAQRAQQLYQCAIDPARAARFDALVAASPLFDQNREAFLREVKASASRAEEILRRAGQEREDQIAATLGPICISGG
jgi:hypothetical protein